LGANWDRSFGPVELNLVALQRLERDENYNASISAGSSQVFHSVGDTAESILRGTVRYVDSKTLMLEGGLEGAYNSLTGTSSFLSNGASISLPGANPKVNEKRGEAHLQVNWRFDPDWLLEAGAKFEYSTIGAQGIPSRSFNFLKPRLLLSWSPIENGQIRVRAERVVGQLDFNNFIASSDFASNGVSAGNLAIRPDQRWQFEGDLEYHFWGKGAVVLSYTRENITDLVDYIPIGNGLDGPGNIPKATNNIYDVEASLPLDRWGLEGFTIKPAMVWKDGAVADPVTGAVRQISNTQDRHVAVDLLQDIQAWHSSLDLTFQAAFQKPYFRIAQVTDYRIYPVYVQFSWDYKPKPDLDLQFKVMNFVPYQFDAIQYNYAGPRDVSPLLSIQDTHTHSEPRILLQLRKTF
jgi:outer membrane receptor protein involved in Fe transport